MPHDILRKKKYQSVLTLIYLQKKTLSFFFDKSKCKYVPIKKNLIDEIWKRKIKKSKIKFYKLPNSSVCKQKYQSKIDKVTNF